MLPDYLAKASPNPATKRAPWYANTAPSYAGIFLWIGFYMQIASGTIVHGSIAVCLAALAVGGVLSYGLFYYVPAMLGMRTGYPLYVVGSSTFGTQGGYLMPGLLMGVLQIGWFAVGTVLSTRFILSGLGMTPQPGTAPFIVVGLLWGYTMAYIGAMGIQYVARVSQFLNFVPLFMLLFVFFQVKDGVAQHQPAQPDSFLAFTMLVQIVIGFFATAGAAGADFGINSRDQRDVRLGGLVGVALAAVVAGGLPLASVAGARVLFPAIATYNYDAVISTAGGTLGAAMFFLFALASIPPSCFCAFIAGNSFATMIPGVPRISSSMAGATVGIMLAVTGVAENLVSFFTIVGASFGPICGAMAADYLLSKGKWSGPREGINWAGYGAWLVGFAVGVLPFLPVPAEVKRFAQPAVVYSFVTGFLAYIVLAKAGLEPKAAPLVAQRVNA